MSKIPPCDCGGNSFALLDGVHTIAKDTPKPNVTMPVTPRFAVQHYTVAEVASLWKLSTDTVRKLFEDEPDVLVIGNQERRFGRRRYSTLRIPEFVVERVYRRQSR
jgi:hypothetical protein